MGKLITGRKGSHSNTATNDIIFDKDKRAMITSLDKRHEALMRDNSILKSVTNLVQGQINQDSVTTVNKHSSNVTSTATKNYTYTQVKPKVEEQDNTSSLNLKHKIKDNPSMSLDKKDAAVPRLPNIGQGQRTISYHSFHFS